MRRWAHNVTAILPERLLHAYVDVLLSPSRRKAVEAALARNPDLQDTVACWRDQNANLQLLALLEAPEPMSREMAGTVHRLQMRLRGWDVFGGLRSAAVIAILIAGAAGLLVLAHAKQVPRDVMTVFIRDAAEAHKSLASEESAKPATSQVSAENHPDTSSQNALPTQPAADEPELLVEPEPQSSGEETAPVTEPELATDPAAPITTPREI